MNETKTCPFCAEDIKAAAVKCKHCGSDLTGKPQQPPPAPPEKSNRLTALGAFLTIAGIPACAAGAVVNSSVVGTGGIIMFCAGFVIFVIGRIVES